MNIIFSYWPTSFCPVYVYRQIKMGSWDRDCPLLRGSVADVCSINTFFSLLLLLLHGSPIIFRTPHAFSCPHQRNQRTGERDAYFFNRRPVTDFVPPFPSRTRFPHGKLNRFRGDPPLQKGERTHPEEGIPATTQLPFWLGLLRSLPCIITRLLAM